ncbi:MAG: hypothetical protein V4787_15570 [Pseudomonadota bacterium]
MTHLQHADHARLIADAKHEAAVLRRDTLDSWMDGAGRAIAHPLRSANRLAASLARHTRIRNNQGV